MEYLVSRGVSRQTRDFESWSGRRTAATRNQTAIAKARQRVVPKCLLVCVLLGTEPGNGGLGGERNWQTKHTGSSFVCVCVQDTLVLTMAPKSTACPSTTAGTEGEASIEERQKEGQQKEAAMSFRRNSRFSQEEEEETKKKGNKNQKPPPESVPPSSSSSLLLGATTATTLKRRPSRGLASQDDGTTAAPPKPFRQQHSLVRTKTAALYRSNHDRLPDHRRLAVPGAFAVAPAPMRRVHTTGSITPQSSQRRQSVIDNTVALLPPPTTTETGQRTSEGQQRQQQQQHEATTAEGVVLWKGRRGLRKEDMNQTFRKEAYRHSSSSSSSSSSIATFHRSQHSLISNDDEIPDEWYRHMDADELSVRNPQRTDGSCCRINSSNVHDVDEHMYSSNDNDNNHDAGDIAELQQLDYQQQLLMAKQQQSQYGDLKKKSESRHGHYEPRQQQQQRQHDDDDDYNLKQVLREANVLNSPIPSSVGSITTQSSVVARYPYKDRPRSGNDYNGDYEDDEQSSTQTIQKSNAVPNRRQQFVQQRLYPVMLPDAEVPSSSLTTATAGARAAAAGTTATQLSSATASAPRLTNEQDGLIREATQNDGLMREQVRSSRQPAMPSWYTQFLEQESQEQETRQKELQCPSTPVLRGNSEQSIATPLSSTGLSTCSTEAVSMLLPPRPVFEKPPMLTQTTSTGMYPRTRDRPPPMTRLRATPSAPATVGQWSRAQQATPAAAEPNEEFGDEHNGQNENNNNNDNTDDDDDSDDDGDVFNCGDSFLTNNNNNTNNVANIPSSASSMNDADSQYTPVPPPTTLRQLNHVRQTRSPGVYQVAYRAYGGMPGWVRDVSTRILSPRSRTFQSRRTNSSRSVTSRSTVLVAAHVVDENDNEQHDQDEEQRSAELEAVIRNRILEGAVEASVVHPNDDILYEYILREKRRTRWYTMSVLCLLIVVIILAIALLLERRSGRRV